LNREYCDICKHEHKTRPKSFCLAINGKGISSLDRNVFMDELMTLYKENKL